MIKRPLSRLSYNLIVLLLGIKSVHHLTYPSLSPLRVFGCMERERWVSLQLSVPLPADWTSLTSNPVANVMRCIKSSMSKPSSRKSFRSPPVLVLSSSTTVRFHQISLVRILKPKQSRLWMSLSVIGTSVFDKARFIY